MRKLLIVDDSRTMRKIIKHVLHKADIVVDDILEANNGLEALEQLVAHPDVELILSDVNMPEMHGLDLLRRVRVDHTKDALPVIMITTEGGDAMVGSALACGANAYLRKPFTMESFRKALEPFLG